MSDDRPEPWFAERRFGYGAGMPIAWQGWVVLAAMIGLITLVALLVVPAYPRLGPMATLGVVLPFLPLIRARTRGGWHWRW